MSFAARPHRFPRLAGALALAVLGLLATAPPAAAQIDYRNLDAGRPVHTEDAYPVERHAFELVLPYTYEHETSGEHGHLVTPELAWGVLPNAMVGAALPLAVLHDERSGENDVGLGAPTLFGLYNLNTETDALPALALRADIALPVGAFAGDAVRAGLTGIATRSWGRTRAHLNGTIGLGGDEGVGAVHAIPDWSAGLAVDRTLLRRSMLLVADLTVSRAASGAETEATLGLGGRLQLTPTLVLDAGVARRLTERVGLDLGLTVGLTHAFAVAGLMPGAAR